MLNYGAAACPECGAERPTPEREPTEVEIELEELREREREQAALLKRLRAVARDRGLPDSWVQGVVSAASGARNAATSLPL